jgi:glycosyltransferase involved in cell wall biosynthesis
VRVLTVGNLYPPHHFGGYEAVWKSAVRHLREQGHEVQVLCTTYRHEGVSDGDDVGIDRALRWYWRDHEFANIPKLDRIRLERHNHSLLALHLDELKPDVVSFWSMGGMSHSLIEDVRRRGLPMVAFVHDEWLNYGRFTDQWLRIFYGRRRVAAPLAEWLTGIPARLSYGAAGRYVFVSEFVRQRTLALDIGDLPDTGVAHSGIDPSFLAPGDEHPWRYRLLHVGRLHPDKGIHHAVAALGRLPEQATLTFAGSWDPRDEQTLEAQVRDLGLEQRVTMLGQRPPAEIAALYREHDVLLFPVVWSEPWGLVPLEAMGCGCPVIATGRGGSGEYLRDDDNCLLVPAEDPGAIAAAVERLAESPELRMRLRAGGTATAPLHTEPVFNEQVERHLTEVVGRPLSSVVPVAS